MKAYMKRVLPLFVSLVVLCATLAVPVSADTSIDYQCDGTVDISLTRDEFYNVIQHCFDSVTSWNTDQSSLVSISQEAGVLMSSGTAYPHFAQAGILTYQKNSSLVYFRLLFADEKELTLARNGSTYRFYLSGANFCCVNLYYNVLNDSFTYISYSVASNAPNNLEACNQSADFLDLTTVHFYYNNNYDSTTDIMWAIIPDYTSLVSLGIESESFGIAYPDYIPEESENQNTGNTGQEQLEVSNNILTNIKNIVQYIANLPSTIFGAFSDFLGSIKTAVLNIPELIGDKLWELFIPSVNIFARIITAFDEKYPIVRQCSDIFGSLFKDIDSNEPKFEMTWKGIKFAIIDFTTFSAHMPLIRNVTAAFLWLAFITHEVRTLPKLIRGRD